MEKEAIKKWLKGLVKPALIGVVLGVIGGIVGYQWGSLIGQLGIQLSFGDRGTFATVLNALILAYIGIFVGMNIHELGHFIAGKSLGYKLIMFKVSIFTWAYENGKMKFLMKMDYRGIGTGLCMMIPPKKQLGRRQEVIFYVSGIVANILFVLLTMICLFLFPNMPVLLKEFIIVNGAMELILIVTNVLPIKIDNNITDGKLVWSLFSNTQEAKEMVHLKEIGAQMNVGMKLKEISLEGVPTTNPQILIIAYLVALDQGDMEQVYSYAEQIEENIDNYPSETIEGIYYELCYVNCIKGNEEQAKKYYKKREKLLNKDKDINGLRVKAYYQYYVNKDTDKALELCKDALKVWEKYPVRSQALLEKDLVEKLLWQCSDGHQDVI